MEKFPITYIGREEIIKDVVRRLATIHNARNRSLFIKETSSIMLLDETALTAEVNELRRRLFPQQVAAELN